MITSDYRRCIAPDRQDDFSLRLSDGDASEVNIGITRVTLDGITNYRPDLYGQLCDAKWRKWNDRAKKWVPIRDWRAYVKGLNNHIQDNF